MSPPLPPVKPFVPALCHGFSLAAHVLLLGGAALFGRPQAPYEATSIEEHVPRAQMLLVAAEPGETVTEEKGGERKVSGPCDEGTIGPVRNDMEHPVPPGELAEAYKVDDPSANDLPPAMFYPALDPGTVRSNWFNGMGDGTGGTQGTKADRGNRIDPPTPVQRRDRGEADDTRPGGGPPKTRVCPPSQGGEVVFCRATSAP